MSRLLAAAARLPAAVLIALVRCYQWGVSPWLGPRCRYQPTCSETAVLMRLAMDLGSMVPDLTTCNARTHHCYGAMGLCSVAVQPLVSMRRCERSGPF